MTHTDPAAVDLDAAELLAALTAATGGTVHRLTVDGPACGVAADASAAWLALDSDPAAVTCPDCAGWHDPMCTGCAHDCPWKRHHYGAPFCQTCDDHAEAAALDETDPPAVPAVEQLRAGTITGPAAVLFGAR